MTSVDAFDLFVVVAAAVSSSSDVVIAHIEKEIITHDDSTNGLFVGAIVSNIFRE